MRKLPQQARSRQLVASLVQATRKAIVLKGVQGITTHGVAAIAGVSQGSLYRYFGDRNQLIDAVLQQLADELAGLVRTCLAQYPGDAERLRWTRQTVGQVADFLSQDDGLCLELAKGWHQLPPRFSPESVRLRVLEEVRGVDFLVQPEAKPAGLEERIFVFINSLVFNLAMLQEPSSKGLRRDTVDELLARMLEPLLPRVTIARRAPHGGTALDRRTGIAPG